MRKKTTFSGDFTVENAFSSPTRFFSTFLHFFAFFSRKKRQKKCEKSAKIWTGFTAKPWGKWFFSVSQLFSKSCPKKRGQKSEKNAISGCFGRFSTSKTGSKFPISLRLKLGAVLGGFPEIQENAKICNFSCFPRNGLPKRVSAGRPRFGGRF